MSFPLLGKSLQVQGEFSLNNVLKMSRNFTTMETEVFIELEDDDIVIENEIFKNLIDSEKAEIVTVIFCGETLFQDQCAGKDRLKIDSNNLCGKTEIRSTVIAKDNFEIDLTSIQSINQFFRRKINVLKGTHLSTTHRRSYNIPTKNSGKSNSLFSIKWAEIDRVEIDFGEDDPTASKIKITYPSESFHTEMMAHFKMRKGLKALSTSLFFESILREMFYLIYEGRKDYTGDNHSYYETLNPWMQELIKQFNLLDYDYSQLNDFEEVYNLINGTPNGSLLIAESLDQLNLLSESNE